MEEQPLSVLHSRLRQLRKENNWTQADLAHKMLIEVKMVSNYETGKVMPSADTLLKISAVFDVSIDYLLKEKAVKRPVESGLKGGFLDKIYEIENLPDKDREVVEHIVDALIARNKVKDLVNE